jgi:recombination associated protein RdgC
VFKNLIIYRIGEGWQADADAVEAELAKTPFQPCEPTALRLRLGAAAGAEHGRLVEVVDGHWLLKLQREQRLLPGSVVTERVDELAEQIEHQTGRKPGKKARKDLKEQAAHELLPRAFTKTGATRVWVAPAQRLLLVDAGSVARADEVTTLLTQAIPGLMLHLLQSAEPGRLHGRLADGRRHARGLPDRARVRAQVQ